MISGEKEAKAFVAERCSDEGLAKLENYVAALVDENSRQNLVAQASLDQIWQRHIADSAQLLEFVPCGTSPWLDLGSGPGLPGLVLAIMRPDEQFVLIESRKRRVEFLQHVKLILDLRNVAVEGKKIERVENLKVSVITARAFAPLPRLIDLSARFSTEDTLWVLPKGRSAEQDLVELSVNLQKMFHVEQSLTDPDAKILVGRIAQEKRARA